MKMKIIIASVVIIAALVFGAASFVETNVEYTDFQTAMTLYKKVQVKGEWLKEKESRYDVSARQFTFSMADDNGVEMKIVYDGAKPNNFELASAVVVKGKYEKNCFHATKILTKCPSKYEADAETVKKAL